MVGITVIIIILIPVAIQVFLLQIKQNKRHLEILESLNKIEAKLGIRKSEDAITQSKSN